RLWILHKLPGAENAYHISGIYNLKGILNPELFNDAISHMIMRHEVLRTTFINVDDHPEQVIHANPLPMAEYVDATCVDTSESWQNEVTQATLHTPFDLSDPSLFRSVLIKTAPDAYRWVVCMHHIISDGWSVDIMLDEIQILYRQLADKSAPKLAPLPIQYKDFASWMDDQQQAPEYAELEQFWLDQFCDPIEPITFPFQKPRPALKSYHGRSISTSIPDETFSQVKSLHKQGFSSFITLTTALSLAFKSILGRNEFVIGTPVAGRFLPELESLIGFFVNVVPIKINLDGHETPKESLQAMRRLIMSALEHQQVSFDKWTSKLDHVNDPSRSPIFDVLVVYHNNPTSNWHLDQVTLTAQDFEEKYSKYDLVVEFTEHESGLELLINYNTDLFESGDMESFTRFLGQILHTITAQPDVVIQSLPALLTTTVAPKGTSARNEGYSTSASDVAKAIVVSTPATDVNKIVANPTLASDATKTAANSTLTTGIPKAASNSTLTAHTAKIPENPTPASGVAKTATNPTLSSSVAKADDPLLRHLKDIWANVLGRADFTETDNFFALGGDSIKAIQISSALYQHGYKLTIAALFSFPTIRELHSRIELITQQTDQEPISGSHPLTPIQSWLFSRDAETLNRFYQSALVKLDHPHPLSVIKTAWKKVMIHHDELRARPISTNDTVSMKIGQSVPQFRFDHRHFGDDDELQQEVVNWLDSWIPDSKVFDDPLCSVLVLTQKSTSERHVFIAVHHLLVDIVSWRPILEDFNTALDGLMNTSEVALPLKTTSFQDWARFVETTRNSATMDPVRRFWADQKPELEQGKLSLAEAISKRTRSTLELTELAESLGNTTRVFQAKMNDVLATAMSRALVELGHGEQVNITQEVHGRDSMPNESVDRTVGWFTNEFPVSIRYHADTARHLREVKEARVRFEEHGRWFMISESAEYVSAIQQSSVGINYVGDVTASEPLKRISIVGDTTIIDQSLEDGLNLGKPITVFGFTQSDTLTLTIESQIESLSAQKIATALARVLSELGTLSHQTDQNVNTPSDFDYDGLDIDSLDDLLKSIK
ncbi:MAG: condensation domain-containing protein, partial [Balneolales bacterium]|nr:condensation domain-containing protein [Balneolales bacterium]